MQTICGYVGLIGRPNVGKSTLINSLLGEKISITCRKPQTTREAILGIKTMEHIQMVFVDTPGIHLKAPRALNRYMNKVARRTLTDVDVIVFIVEAGRTTPQDAAIFEEIKLKAKVPVILVINKVDLVPNKEILLQDLKKYQESYAFAEIIPLSAKTHDQVDVLEKMIQKYLPENPHFFESHQTTAQGPNFQAAELIREKIFRFLGDELPYSVTVEIERMSQEETRMLITACIWVERESQKKIIIGREGLMLKAIGTQARWDLKKWLKQPVHLELWVKVKESWADSEHAMKHLGFQSFD